MWKERRYRKRKIFPSGLSFVLFFLFISLLLLFFDVGEEEQRDSYRERERERKFENKRKRLFSSSITRFRGTLRVGSNPLLRPRPPRAFFGIPI